MKAAEFMGDTKDGWHRPDGGQFYPRDQGKDDADRILQNVCTGWRPPAPFITKSQLITAFGSCFATNIEEYLRQRGYRTSISTYNIDSQNYWGQSLLVKCGEGFVNTFSIRDQLEWIWEGKGTAIEVWLKQDGKVQKWIDDNWKAGQSLLGRTDVFIITLGLSEVAYHKKTGHVLWAGVPESEWETGEYAYRVSTVAENFDNLSRIVDLIRKHRGNVPIIFTLSPIPLMMTFRPVSCMTANSVSKAILRVAVDELMRSRDDLFYWPAYDIVTSWADRPFSEDGIEFRHLRSKLIDCICEAFMKDYCAAH